MKLIAQAEATAPDFQTAAKDCPDDFWQVCPPSREAATQRPLPLHLDACIFLPLVPNVVSTLPLLLPREKRKALSLFLNHTALDAKTTAAIEAHFREVGAL